MAAAGTPLTLLAALAVLAAAALQSATGFGFALIAAPALLALFEPVEAITSVLVFALLVNLLMLAGERRSLSVRAGDVALVLLTALPGLALGVLVLKSVDREGLQVVVGVSVMTAAALATLTLGAGREASAGGGGRVTGALAGMLAGVFTTATSVNGPPLVLWMLQAGRSAEEMRDSLSAVFVCLNVAGLATVALSVEGAGAVSAGVLLSGALAAVGGWLAGRYAFTRMSDARFAGTALVVAFTAGLASLAAGLV